MIDVTAPSLSFAELYYFKVPHGVELYLTSAASSINFKDSTYTPATIRRGSIKHTTDIVVPSLDVILGVNTVTLDGRNVLSMLCDGYFDGADFALVLYERLTDTYEYLWRGVVADETEADSFEVTLKVKTMMYMFENTVPRNVYQKQCNNTLYDTCCGLDKSLFKSAGTVTSGDRLNIYADVFGNHTDCYFQYGIIKMTSGANAGQQRMVSYHGYGMVTVDKALWNDTSVGDTFDIWAGCDKTSSTCSSKFANLNNFLGFEYIPEADTVITI